MAFPTVRSTIGGSNSANTNHTITLPATIGPGDLLIAFLMVETGGGTRTATWDSNTDIGTWTQLWHTQDGGLEVLSACWYYIADGTEDSQTLNLLLSANNVPAWRIYSIQDWEGTSGGITAGTPVTGNGATADPPSVTAAGGSGDNLFIVSVGRDDAGNGSITSWDSDFTDNIYNDLSANGLQATATAEIAAATEDPTACAWDGNLEQYVVNTVVVEPAAAGTSIPVFSHHYTKNTGSGL